MRILVVEDEEKVSRFVVRGLTAERFAVDVARDGKGGWELAQTYQYDLVILDLMLPGLTGGEVLRRIRKGNSQVPVLILTARDTLGDKVEHFEAGADDYLTKPFAFAELLVRVKALLRRGPVTRASVLRIGDLELDRLAQQVKRAGKRIELTSKEYGVLEYLMANAGRVLSRTMILEHVWDQSFDGATNIVDVYVRHLRAKVDDPHRLYHVVNGRRSQFAGANLKVTSGEWHELRVEIVGSKITCYYDGNKKIEATDGTFKDAGKIGLWTKADSVTYFDDLKATAK
jgi:DNA-binding response OmpR family regulator